MRCECLQGQAAPLARLGLLGRRVSQVGSNSGVVSISIDLYAGMISSQGFVQRREGMWPNVRHCDCLQGQAAPQARRGLPGRRVSQVGTVSGVPLG